MSFVRNRQDQISFQNGEYLLTGREKAMLKNSWATFFAESVFPKIDEEPFGFTFSFTSFGSRISDRTCARISSTLPTQATASSSLIPSSILSSMLSL